MSVGSCAPRLPLKFQLTLVLPDEELELLDEDELLEDELLELEDELLELDEELLLEDELLEDELELLEPLVPPHAASAASSPSKMRNFMWHPLMFWIFVPQRPRHHKTIGQARKRIFESRELSHCEIVTASPNAARRYCILRSLLSFSAPGWPGRYHW